MLPALLLLTLLKASITEPTDTISSSEMDTDTGIPYQTPPPISSPEKLLSNFTELNNLAEENQNIDHAVYTTSYENVILYKNDFYEFTINQLNLVKDKDVHNATVFFNISITNYKHLQNPVGPNLFESLNLFKIPNPETQVLYAKYKAGILNAESENSLRETLCSNVIKPFVFTEEILLIHFGKAPTTTYIIDSSNLCDKTLLLTDLEESTKLKIGIDYSVNDFDNDYLYVLLCKLFSILNKIRVCNLGCCYDSANICQLVAV